MRHPLTARLVLVMAVIATVGLSACSSGASVGSRAASPSEDSVAPFAIDQDFPDPDVSRFGDTYYAYATNTAAVNVQIATSSDLKKWTVSDVDALPTLPAWALPGRTWAPDVSEFSPGHFVMYFTTANADPAFQCIGVATATAPEGPFRPVGASALVCPADQGGAIDPSTFVDSDGSRHLVWKNDGNCCAKDTWLQIAPLSADGLQLAGPATKLIKQTDAWEGSLIEAPVLVKHGSTYVLFYSANNYGGDQYAIGYATASKITGPFTKHDGPWLSTSLSKGRYLGPGGEDVITAADGTDRLVFHSWDPAVVYRGMHVVRLNWKGDEPVVGP
jgi:arabinan endo-1,5-alpha-L-arabinosidase